MSRDPLHLRLYVALAFVAAAFLLKVAAADAPPTAEEFSSVGDIFSAAKVADNTAALFTPLRPAALPEGAQLRPAPRKPRKTVTPLTAAPANIRAAVQAATGTPLRPAFDARHRQLVAAGIAAEPPAPGKYSPLYFWKRDIDEVAALVGEDAVHDDRILWLRAARDAGQ